MKRNRNLINHMLRVLEQMPYGATKEDFYEKNGRI